MQRELTRIERYTKKNKDAVTIPLSFASINFRCDDNLAFLIRTAACFGVDTIHVVGSVPPRKVLFNASGSLVDYIDIKQYSRPSQLLDYARTNDIEIFSAELSSDSKSLYKHKFNFDCETMIVLGNETSGVPEEILFRSKKLYIPMLGTGFCLNTSQTGTAFASEYVRQYVNR